MRRAAKTDVTHSPIVAALRKAGCSVLSLAAVAGGCPDILACKGGRAWLFEVKNPDNYGKKREPNSLQEAWHARWTGCPVVVVFTPEDAIRTIKEALA